MPCSWRSTSRRTTKNKGGAKAYADGTIDMIEGFARQWPDKFALARSADGRPVAVRQRSGLDPPGSRERLGPGRRREQPAITSTLAAFGTSR